MSGAHLLMALMAGTVTRVQLNTQSGLSGYRIAADGMVEGDDGGGGGYVDLEQWLLVGPNSDFQVQATVVSGTFSGTPTGVWAPATSDRTWTVVTASGSLDVSIRDAAAPNTVRVSNKRINFTI